MLGSSNGRHLKIGLAKVDPACEVGPPWGVAIVPKRRAERPFVSVAVIRPGLIRVADGLSEPRGAPVGK